jgi:beta-glucanase (GH16 family)
MRPSAAFSRAALSLSVLLGACAARAADAAPAGWEPAWSDEFEGAAIDPAKWDFDLGNGFYNYAANLWISGWGNGELEYYTREPANAYVKDGLLHIRAVKESRDGCGYTSARLKSRKRDGTPLFTACYGRIEFRAKLPVGKGLWPALWLLPHDETYGPWASSGEIDVLETRGHEPEKVTGAIHFGSRWPANTYANFTYALPAGGRIDAFHVYALEWEPGVIRWYTDGALTCSRDFWWSCSKTEGDKGAAPKQESDINPWPAPFDKPFYLLMNLAVGGQFGGNPDATTVFPAEMQVDYVRVFRRAGGPGPAQPRGAGKLPF